MVTAIFSREREREIHNERKEGVVNSGGGATNFGGRGGNESTTVTATTKITSSWALEEELDDVATSSQGVEDCRLSDKLRKAIASSFFHQAARLASNGSYITVRDGHMASLHPDSVISSVSPPPPWIVFFSAAWENGLLYLQGATPVSPSWLLSAAPSMYRVSGGGGGGGLGEEKDVEKKKKLQLHQMPATLVFKTAAERRREEEAAKAAAAAPKSRTEVGNSSAGGGGLSSNFLPLPSQPASLSISAMLGQYLESGNGVFGGGGAGGEGVREKKSKRI